MRMITDERTRDSEEMAWIRTTRLESNQRTHPEGRQTGGTDGEIMNWNQREMRTNADLAAGYYRCGRRLKRKERCANRCLPYLCPHDSRPINENADPDVTRDIIATLNRLVPATGDYRHVEGNSDAHVKASIMGFSAIIPVIDGHLALGTWQALYFCEFDGPRHRNMVIGISGD